MKSSVAASCFSPRVQWDGMERLDGAPKVHCPVHISAECTNTGATHKYYVLGRGDPTRNKSLEKVQIFFLVRWQ